MKYENTVLSLYKGLIQTINFGLEKRLSESSVVPLINFGACVYSAYHLVISTLFRSVQIALKAPGFQSPCPVARQLR